MILKNPENGLWFLWSLFFITVFLYFFDSVSRKIRIRQEYVVLLGVILLMGLGMVLKKKTGSNDFGLNVTAWYMIFYVQGFYVRKYQHVLIPLIGKYLPALFVIFIVSAYFWDRRNAPAFLPDQLNIYIVNVIYRLLVATLGIFSFYGLARKFVGNTNDKMMVNIINKIGGVHWESIVYNIMLSDGQRLYLQVLICFYKY